MLVPLPDALQFFSQGLRHSSTVGAVWPSSRGLAEAMARPVFAARDRAARILEVGAGVGPVTYELTARLTPGDVLDVVELNPAFCATLRERFAGVLPGPVIHEADVLDHDPGLPYDFIVSGLPLASFPADRVEAIYRRFFELLAPEGRLIMFEHLGFRPALAAVAVGEVRRRMHRIVDFEARLRPLQVDARAVPFNVPPALVRVRRRPVAPL